MRMSLRPLVQEDVRGGANPLAPFEQLPITLGHTPVQSRTSSLMLILPPPLTQDPQPHG
jgi:hypothetical protein